MNVYREPAPSPIRYVCGVCCRTATRGIPGACSCGAPRLPIEAPEVVGMLRTHADRRQAARLRLWMPLAAFVAAGLALGLCLAFGLQIDTDRGTTRGGGGSWFFGLGAVFIAAAIGLVYWRSPPPPEDPMKLLEWLKVRVED